MTTPTNIVGLDMSSTSTGVCAGGDCHTITAKGETMERAQAMRAGIVPFALAADVIVYEGLGTRFIQTAISLGHVHALVLDQIGGHGRLVEVSPARLKKYATGKGNANKDAMIRAARKAGGVVRNNDEADAWHLWAIGCHLIGQPVVPDTAYRADVIEALAC